jgi:hypothetical protein
MLGRAFSWTLLLGLSLVAGSARAGTLHLGLCPVQREGGGEADRAVDASLAAQAAAWPGVSSVIRLDGPCPADNVNRLMEAAKAAQADRVAVLSVDGQVLRVKLVDAWTGEKQEKLSPLSAPTELSWAAQLSICELLAPNQCSGMLAVDGVPGSRVLIDEVEAGVTPLNRVMPIGKHSVRVVNDAAQTEANSVVITAQQQQKLQVESSNGKLAFKGNDFDALPDLFLPDDPVLPPADPVPAKPSAPAVAETPAKVEPPVVAVVEAPPAPPPAEKPPEPAATLEPVLVIALPPGTLNELEPSSPALPPATEPVKEVTPPPESTPPPVVANVEAPVVSAPDETTSPAKTTPEVPGAPRKSNWSKPAFVTTAVVAGAALVSGIVFGVVSKTTANSLNEKYDRRATSIADRSSYDTVQTTATVANVSYGVAGLSAVVAGIIFATHPTIFGGGGDEPPVAVGLTGVSVGGRF